MASEITVVPDESIAILGRRGTAANRAREAGASLAECHLCAHQCGVNRIRGERGRCHAGSESRVFSAQVEVTDELEIAPTYAIALSGCDLRCSFCITGAQSWNPYAGRRLEPARVANDAQEALSRGARSIMFLGGEPSVHLPAVLEIVSCLPDEARLVWKTNAHHSSQARRLLAGIFDVWVADLKFGNDACAGNLAKVSNYENVVRANLQWAAGQTDLIIRHVLMPGHLECCWRPIAIWIAEFLPQAKVSLRTGFWPAWNSWRHSELLNLSDPGEAKAAQKLAEELHLNLIS